MKAIRLLMAVCVFGAAASLSSAQQPAPAAPPAPGGKGAAAQSPAQPPAQPPGQTKAGGQQKANPAGGDDEFIPSEEINADEEVTFPVDI